MVKITPRIAVFGGSGYLASLLKNQKNYKEFKFTFYSRKKTEKNYINYLSLKKKSKIFNKFDYIIHLAGPNQSKLKNNKKLIKTKNKLTSSICDICLDHNIKLIYLSSLQIYKNYGKNNINNNSKINLENSYAKLHYDSEKIILKKFLNHKKKFIILRMGNVFGFNAYNNLKQIKDNLIHSLCISAKFKNKILIKNGSLQRTFIPSQIFVQLINFIIKKKLFNNSIENISYKNLNLKEVAKIIQKRFEKISKLSVFVKVEKFNKKKNFKISFSRNFKLNSNIKKIYFEIDQVFKYI